MALLLGGGVGLSWRVALAERALGLDIQADVDADPFWAAGHGVSILTRPGGRVLPGGQVAALVVLVVSILTRPEGQVLPLQVFGLRHTPQLFQSSPAPKGRCY